MGTRFVRFTSLRWASLRRPGTVVACLLAAAVVVGGVVACGPGEPPAAAPQLAPGVAAPSGPPFVESAEACGIRFRMNFMPGEQGEKFKTNLYDHGCGTCVADYDGDGDDDILFLNQLGPNALYRNDGVKDGHPVFTDVAESAGVALTDRICVAACFSDVDDDGDQDLYVTTTRGGNAMLRNDGDHAGDHDGHVRFTDVTNSAGLTLVGHCETPCFFDYDGDGDQDLFVSNTAQWTTDVRNPEGKYFEGMVNLFDLVAAPVERNRMYRNEGGWKFSDVTVETGLAGPGWGGDVAPFDYDDDGDQDLFVGSMFGGSTLYRNDGGAFTDVTRALLGRPPWGTVGAKVFDYDGDGRLDLYILDMHSDMWVNAIPEVHERQRYAGPEGASVEGGTMTPDERAALRAKLKVKVEDYIFGNALYRNLGGGKFEETSGAAGAETFWPWGAATADFDLDGDQDVYIPSGMGYPYFYWRAPFLLNSGKGTFTEASRQVGLDPPPGGNFNPEKIGSKPAPRSSRSAATGDFDGDGRPDLVVNNFNGRAFLYMNRFARGPWIGLRLHGTRLNGAGGRDAVGAVATIRVGGRTLTRHVETSGGYLAQSSRTLSFGLADAAKEVSAEIRWPGGRTQTVTGLTPGRVHDITQQ